MKLFSNTQKKKLKKNIDNRGFFIEIFRLDQLDFNSKISQVSHSYIKKNILKGWHFHKRQTQWNYLLKGKTRVFLIDYRKKSKTYEKIITFIVNSNKRSCAYFFPANIGHAYITLGKENHMIYATSGHYNPKEEYKLPFDKELVKKYKKNNI
jgi:dTDP-4-dehydrorhamnose 3,5-epimerase